MMNNLSVKSKHRLSLASRVLAASLGAYVLMIIANSAFIFLLPLERRTAFLYTVQAGFLIYSLAIIWVFSARTATKAWLGLLACALPLALLDVYYYWQGAAI